VGLIGLTMLALAVTPAVPPVALPPIQVPRVVVQVPPVNVPPVNVPPVKLPPVKLPPVNVPPVELPKVELPPVAKPPVTPPAPPIAPPSTPTGETPAAPKPTATETPSGEPAGPRGETPRGETPRREPRRDRRAAAPRRESAAPRGDLAPRSDTTTRMVAATATPAAAARAAIEPDKPAAGIADEVIDLVEALPQAILWSVLGIVLIALGLAANAFRLSRHRRALELQRGALLDDIGLLSQALLPPVPAFDGLTVSAAYRPADGPAAGGDFYDVFALDDDRVGILLGDVSGHGRDSVTLAALARFTLRTLLAAGHGPGAALAEADRLLEREMRPRFVTVIAAVYDRRTTRLTYAKAGHAPPIVTGTAHDPDAEVPACPIGVGVGTDWPEYHVDLADGVSVCLVTDGFEEARRDGTRLGRAEVERLVAAQHRPDAACLLNDLGTLADQVSDDTAAVVVARA
jgi:stage II sporulation SpoE-like protein